MNIDFTGTSVHRLFITEYRSFHYSTVTINIRLTTNDLAEVIMILFIVTVFDNDHFGSVKTRPIQQVYICIKVASILNSQSRDLKDGSIYCNHYDVTILSMKSLVRLKEQVKA